MSRFEHLDLSPFKFDRLPIRPRLPGTAGADKIDRSEGLIDLACPSIVLRQIVTLHRFEGIRTSAAGIRHRQL